MIACQARREYRVMLGAALTVGVTPIEVKEIVYQPNGKLYYTLVTSLKPPAAVQTIGDRVTGLQVLPIKFYEEDLIGYREALEMCIANLQIQLNDLQRLYQGLT